MEKGISIPPDFTVNKSPIFRSFFEGDVYDWGPKLLNLPIVHGSLTGAGVKVGIADTGFFKGHPDLDDGIRHNHFIGPTPEDIDGHGTHVRGIIAGLKNGKGYIGVAPGCTPIVAKVLHKGTGTNKSVSDGIRWLVDSGAQIINGSLGSNSDNPEIVEALNYAFSKNVLCIFASGNESNKKVSFPARIEDVIAVGAIDERKILAHFSNTGLKLDFVAPGFKIKSTWIDGEYREASGTSMATPMVTGVFALYYEQFNKENNRFPTPKEAFEALIASAEDLYNPGKDDTTGYGLITTNFKSIRETISQPETNTETPESETEPLDPRTMVIIFIVLAAFAAFLYGVFSFF